MTVETVSPPVKRRNVLGIIALVVVLFAYLIPIIATILGLVFAAPDPTGLVTNDGWAWLSALFWAFIGVVVAGIVAAIGLILGIISLFVKLAGRVASIVAISLGALPVIVLLGILAVGGLTALGQ